MGEADQEIIELWNTMWPKEPLYTGTHTPSGVWEKRFPLLQYGKPHFSA